MRKRDYFNYEIYDDGRIYSKKYKKFISPALVEGNLQVVLIIEKDGKRVRKCWSVQKFIAEVFDFKPSDLKQVLSFKNWNRLDVKLSNLIYRTRSEVRQHYAYKNNNTLPRLTPEDYLNIRLLAEQGMSHSKIAEHYRNHGTFLSRPHVTNIVNGLRG